jgi:hypothetical protein
MKQKYIDVGPVIAHMQRNLIPNTDEAGMVFVNDAERYFISLLEKAPEVKIESVRHASWTGFPNNGVWDIKCSNCHRLIPFGQSPHDLAFCPYCGSKMDGEK